MKFRFISQVFRNKLTKKKFRLEMIFIEFYLINMKGTYSTYSRLAWNEIEITTIQIIM